MLQKVLNRLQPHTSNEDVTPSVDPPEILLMDGSKSPGSEILGVFCGYGFGGFTTEAAKTCSNFNLSGKGSTKHEVFVALFGRNDSPRSASLASNKGSTLG